MQTVTEARAAGEAHRKPRRKRLQHGGIVVVSLLAAGGLAAYGVIGRSSSEAKLAQWTDRQATPTVSVVAAQPERDGHTLTLPGTIDAYDTAPIYARVNGYLKAWYKDIGDHVKAGDVLATIEAPDLDQQLDQARADLASAEAQVQLADITAKRWQALLGAKAVSVQASDEKAGDALAKRAAVRAAQANVQRMEALESFKTLRAPFDGIVIARDTDIGALINAGSAAPKALFSVADNSRMRVYVRVPQSFAAEIHVGQTAELSLPQYPAQRFPASVITTANAIDSQTRTVLVELLAANAEGKLWPGTYASIAFAVGARPGVMLVPSSALVFRDRGPEIAVLAADDRVLLKPVTLGEDRGVDLEVLSGLQAGDEVVATPSDSIAAGERVRVGKPERQPS